MVLKRKNNYQDGSDHCRLTAHFVLGDILSPDKPDTRINLPTGFVLQNGKTSLVNYQIPEFFLQDYTGK